MTLERRNARWGDTKLDSVLDPSRSRNLKTEDLEKRRFLYVVAIDMYDRGLLDCNNEPTGRALQGCRLACEAFAQSSGLRLSAANYTKTAPSPPAAKERKRRLGNGEGSALSLPPPVQRNVNVHDKEINWMRSLSSSRAATSPPTAARRFHCSLHLQGPRTMPRTLLICQLGWTRSCTMPSPLSTLHLW